MEFAINDACKRIHASIADKNEEYFCPICKQKVIPRKGQTNADHFAHVVQCTDNWHYDMSEWHSQWQSQFPSGNREVVVQHLGKKHRADVMACGYVIEFQHSPITAEEFEERNNFYRSISKKVIWIFDLVDEYTQTQIECYDEWHDRNGSGGKFCWKHPKRFLQNYIPQNDKNIIVFFQTSEEDHCNKEACYIERVVWAIEEDDDFSNFKRFWTSYNDPMNASELLEWVKNRKL